MAVRFAVFTILSIAACFWVINIARDPKKWRLHWLDFLTVLDIDTHREQRVVMEGQLRTIAQLLLVIFAAAAISCAFWTVDQIREEQRTKTAPERDSDYIRKQIEEVGKIPRRR